MSEKLYLQANDLLEDAFNLGARIISDGFRPTFIVAIWRGGAPIGIAVQEILAWSGIKADHIAIRTSSYDSAIDERQREVKIYGLRYLIDRINASDRLLLVDDVYDTGHTVKAVIDKINQLARLNTPEDIRIAVPWYKPGRNRTGRAPDYFLHETEQWIKFPHSLEGLTRNEIRKHRPEISTILDGH